MPFCCFSLSFLFNEQNNNPPRHLAEPLNLFQITIFLFLFSACFCLKDMRTCWTLPFNKSDSKQTSGISPFSHPILKEQPSSLLLVWLTAVVITNNFSNKTYCVYLTSYKKPKACKQTGFSVMNFCPKDTEMEIIALWKFQSLGFKINQTELNILLQF